VDDLTFYQALRGPRAEGGEACLRSLMKKTAQTTPVKKPISVQDTHAISNDIQARMAEVVKRLKAIKAGKIKKGSAEEAKKQVLDRLKAHAPELIGGGVGTVAGGLYGYLASRRKDPKKPSAMEEDAAKMLRAYERAEQEMKEEGKKPGFPHKMRGVYARAFADASKVMKEHPVATGAMYGGAAGSAGAGLGRIAYDLYNSRIGKGLDV